MLMLATWTELVAPFRVCYIDGVEAELSPDPLRLANELDPEDEQPARPGPFQFQRDPDGISPYRLNSVGQQGCCLSRESPSSQ